MKENGYEEGRLFFISRHLVGTKRGGKKERVKRERKRERERKQMEKGKREKKEAIKRKRFHFFLLHKWT